MQNNTVLLGMSGGIDSFTSAVLLKNKGYKVVGITFVLWDNNSNLKYPEYVNEAEKLAKKIGIEHKVIDLRVDFDKHIINYFKNEYLAGRTPNPCVKCNTLLKWKVLNEQSKLLNIRYISTGHYANIKKKNNLFYISKGLDEEKEQSFFLWGINQEILSKTILPLGKYTKQQVKDIALNNGFEPNTQNKESIGMCFTQKKDYRLFLNKLLRQENKKITKGRFIDTKGNFLGNHKGYPFYTVGQRHGLELVTNNAMYVVKIDAKTNTIILGSRDNLYKNYMLVKDFYFHSLDDTKNEVISKIRYRKQAAKSTIEIINNKLLKVNFIPHEWSIAPGQTAAFYIDDRVIGGGIIC